MSNVIFHPSVLVVGLDDYIALKYIESMHIEHDENEELVIETLKGDAHIWCKMISGREYRVSMLEQYRRFDKQKLPEDMRELRQCIFDKWYCLVAE